MAELAGVVVSAVSCVAHCFSPAVIRRINRWREFKSNFESLKEKYETLKAERMRIQTEVEMAKRDGDGIKEDVQKWLERAEKIEVKIQKWLETVSEIIGDDQEAGEIKKDEDTGTAGEIGRVVEISAAAAARKIEEGEEMVVAAAAAGEIRADEEKTAAKKRCFKGLCCNLKSRYQLSKEVEKLLKDIQDLEAWKFDKNSGIRRINSLRQFKTNFQELKSKFEMLKAERLSLQRDVIETERNGDGIRENVQNWLKRAEELEVAAQKWLEPASKIIGDDQAAGEIGGEAEIAPAAAGEIREDIQATAVAAREIGEGEETVAASAAEIKADEEKTKSRYQLREEAEKLLEDVVKHVETGKFDKISYLTVPRDLRRSNEDYEAFQSRTSTLMDLINSLSDPNVNVVGIFGMAGIGKTTLANEVGNQLEASRLFRSVIFAEVTDKPDIIKIQKEIAEKLPGLTFSHDDTVSSRASKLCQRLENEENILIILDNIWAEIDLGAIGISLGKGRKLLLTARSVDVLSIKRETPRNFGVQCLDDEEAWWLFKKMSSDNIEGSDFESLAREITNKCARLPIAIVTVARALRNKELFEWEDALQQMKTHSSDNMMHVRKSIELSYEYLSPVLKKTIMLIRYADLTSIDRLLMLGMCLDLFERIDKLEGRRTRVRTLVKQLKDSCLLLDSNTTAGDFSMHDVVRDVVISIASREGHVFTNELTDELVWPDENTLKVCHSVVLKNVKRGELPRVLECQLLKFLSISGVLSYSLKLHDEFFIRMTELKVLVLAHVDLRSSSPSLHCLTNLQALELYNCQLDDIAFIGDLTKMEILSLKCSIKRLPKEIGHLTRLKSLDLRYRLRTNIIPPKVLSSLSHLEELYMNEFRGWEEEGLNKDRKCVSLDELKHLSNLTCLEIEIQDAKTLPRDLFFNKLESYKITIGPNKRRVHKHRIEMPQSCRNFNLSLVNTNICLNDGHIMQLKKIEDLCLVGSQDMKSVLYELDRDGFQHLKSLQVTDNGNLLCIADSMKYATNNAFPVLESLLIYDLINLEKICHDRLTTESSFSQLRRIEVGGCSKLKNIFSFSIARRLQLLQSIDVSDCESMKEIFAIEREDESSCNISEVIDTIELSQLRSLYLSSLPQLKSLEYNSNGSNTLFNGKVVLPSLKVLEMHKLNVERIWKNQFADMSSGIQSLTRLILKDCNNLRCLFSTSSIRTFVRLQYLEIWDCPHLEEVVVIDERTDAVFPQLQRLTMTNLKNLSKLCLGDFIEFPSLKILQIKRCPKFKELVSKNINTDISLPFFNEKVALPSFEVLALDQFNSELNVETIWRNQVVPTPYAIENLTRLIVSGCNNLRCLFSSSSIGIFVRLQYLQIRDCLYLEEIIAVDEKKDVVFPQLQFLKMEGLENLSKFYSGDFIQFSSLKKLKIKRCHQLREFLVNYISTDSRGISFPFFNDKVALPSLEKLILRHCNNLKCLFSSSVIGSFDQLQYLKIDECQTLEEIIVIDDEDGLRKEERKNNVPNLEMMVKRCHKLKTLFPHNMYRKFLRLESLSIFDCNLLEVIFDLKGPDLKNKHHASEITELSQLNVGGLPKLKQVWNNDRKISISFEKLKEVSIFSCEVLKNVFPASAASGLSQLESLYISQCGVEEVVFVVEEESETSSRFVFPRLISLTLKDLPNFTTFFFGRYAQSSFFVQKIFPNLERLIVQGKSVPMIWHFLEDQFCKLHHLEVSLDKSSGISSLDFLKRFHSIKEIVMVGHTSGYYNSPRNKMPVAIKGLNKCSDLKHILKEESNMDHLILLEVKYCDNLVNLLMPSSTSLRNLTILVVSKCNRLTNIVTSSTAKSMGQLREMRIIGCSMITELVPADEEDEANDTEIVFSKLKELALRDLGCLTGFCSANYTLNFPSLEEILVEKCPKMKSFTKRNVRTPKLQNIKLQRGLQVEKCWKGDLNTTIKELYKGKKAQSSEEDPGPPFLLHLREEMLRLKSKQMIFNEDEEVNTEDDD